MTLSQKGDRISNYLLEAPIGSGSFGQVWRAKHHVFDEMVAIKIPTNADFVQNLRREGVTIHGLRHPNIVRAIDLDPYGDPPYLVMELVEGASVRETLDAHPNGLPIHAAVAIMRGVLNALAVAHEAGVIHRDVKPANILLTRGLDELDLITEQCVKVTDFGLGRAGGVTAQSIMQSGSVGEDGETGIGGTLAYMAPEHKEGRDVDGRADLYSCGIVLFEMLTGSRPHGAEMPSDLRPDVPGWLDDVFRRCYVRLDRRFTNARNMQQAIAGAAAATPPPIPPSSRRAGKCPACNERVKADDQYCTHCGVQVVEHVPRCQRCDGFVGASDRFCIFCGNDLRVRSS